MRTGAQGYERFQVSIDGENHVVSVHRLLATLKHDLSDFEGREVHHINNVPWDNRLENLELVTYEEHYARHPKTGEKNSFSRLTWEDVDEIRDRYGDETITELGEEFGVTPQNIWQIVNEEIWVKGND